MLVSLPGGNWNRQLDTRIWSSEPYKWGPKDTADTENHGIGESPQRQAHREGVGEQWVLRSSNIWRRLGRKNQRSNGQGHWRISRHPGKHNVLEAKGRDKFQKTESGQLCPPLALVCMRDKSGENISATPCPRLLSSHQLSYCLSHGRWSVGYNWIIATFYNRRNGLANKYPEFDVWKDPVTGHTYHTYILAAWMDHAKLFTSKDHACHVKKKR